MRRFYLDRNEDVTGVSGTGCVAAGCLFVDGTVVIRWFGAHATTTVHASMESVEFIHLHAGRTKIRWRDNVCFACGATEERPDQTWCIYCGAAGSPVEKKDPSLGSWSKAIVIEPPAASALGQVEGLEQKSAPLSLPLVAPQPVDKMLASLKENGPGPDGLIPAEPPIQFENVRAPQPVTPTCDGRGWLSLNEIRDGRHVENVRCPGCPQCKPATGEPA